MISAHHNLGLLSSSNSCASASWVAGTTGMYNHTWLSFVFLSEMGFHHVGQAGLKLMTSGDPPTLTSQSSEIGVSHHTRLNQNLNRSFQNMLSMTIKYVGIFSMYCIRISTFSPEEHLGHKSWNFLYHKGRSSSGGNYWYWQYLFLLSNFEFEHSFPF